MLSGKELKRKIEEYLYDDGEEDFTILLISLTGSSLFLPESEAGDIDVQLVIDGLDKPIRKKYFTIDDKLYDVFIETPDYLKKRLNFDVIDGRTVHNVFYGLNKTLYGEFDYSFDIFKDKDKYREVLKKEIYKSGFNPKSTSSDPSWKKFVEPYMVLKFWEKGEYVMDIDMKKTIQELYLKENIRAVKWVADQLGMDLNPRIKAKYRIR